MLIKVHKSCEKLTADAVKLQTQQRLSVLYGGCNCENVGSVTNMLVQDLRCLLNLVRLPLCNKRTVQVAQQVCY